MLTFLLYFLAGGFVGTLSGMFGIGGGVLIVPVLKAIFSRDANIAPVAMKMAVATSLAIMIMTSLSALAAHARQGGVRRDFVWRLVPGLVTGALIGAQIVYFIPAIWLHAGFAVFLLVTGLRFLLASYKDYEGATAREGKKVANMTVHLFAILTGVFSGMLGVGGGTLLVPFLLWAGLSLHEAAGTSVVGGLSTGLAATSSFVLTGYYIDWTAFFGVAVASVFAAPLGVRLVRWLPYSISQRLFGSILMLTATDMLITG